MTEDQAQVMIDLLVEISNRLKDILIVRNH